jgi:hypothetical protein
MGKTFPEVCIDVVFGGIYEHSIRHEILDREMTADAANKGSSQVEVNTRPFFF